MGYFKPIPETLDELKSAYRKLAMQHHPDVGGDGETMKAIINEYEALFNRVKSFHRNKDGKIYEKETNETPEEFRDIIEALFKIKMADVDIELIGSFIWLTGNTKPYKEEIKALKFRWSQNKTAWYLPPEGYRRRSRKHYDLEEIRTMFDSEIIREKKSDNKPMQYKIGA